MEERRTGERYRVWFPITIVTDDGEEGTAITYDCSSQGMLVACPGKLEVDDHVTLRFRLPDEAEVQRLGATVVRVSDNDDIDGPWLFKLAVHFDEAQPELDGKLQRAAEESEATE